jgi:hypothetical protein
LNQRDVRFVKSGSTTDPAYPLHVPGDQGSIAYKVPGTRVNLHIVKAGAVS